MLFSFSLYIYIYIYIYIYYYLFYIITFSCRAQGWPFYFGLILPFGLIYIFNIIMFIIIIVNLIRRPNVQKEAAKGGNFKKLKENFWLTIGLSILFGVLWVFGMLATAGLPVYIRIPFDIVFTVLVSLQGVFLFLLYCVKSPESRKLWKNWMLCRFTKRSQSQVSTSGSHRKRSTTAMSSGTGSGTKLSHLGSRIAAMNQYFVNPFSRKQSTLTSTDISSSVVSPPPMTTSPIELVRQDNAMLGYYEDEFTEKIAFKDHYSVESVYFGMTPDDKGPSKEGRLITNPMFANVEDEMSTNLQPHL